MPTPSMPDASSTPHKARELTLITVGEKGETIQSGPPRRPRRRPGADASPIAGKIYDVCCRWPGAFQASNALVAAGLAIGLGEDAAKVFAALAQLKGAPGRMEKVAFAANGAPIYVDYAHTPDSLEKVLEALRPHTGEQAACGVRLRRRPRQGQASADGRHRRPRWPMT